jgi:hypothetical protein
MAFFQAGTPIASASSVISPSAELFIDHGLHRQLVLDGSEEFAHQHVETAVAAQCDDWMPLA